MIGKRADGYHAIRTVFQSIGLADELLLSESASGLKLRASYADQPLVEEDLTIKAAKLLREKTGCTAGADISLKKNIPVAAGLAGGSADAAAALAGLNRLWKLSLDEAELEALGAIIGADVPFCLRGGTVLGEGKGDQLRDFPSLLPIDVVLVKPDFTISSKMLYHQWDDYAGRGSSTELEGDTEAMEKAILDQDKKTLGSCLVNDLEPVAIRLYPNIEKVKKLMLAEGALGALMSGSGPTVFALADSRETAEHIARSANRVCPYVMITKTYSKGLNITE